MRWSASASRWPRRCGSWGGIKRSYGLLRFGLARAMPDFENDDLTVGMAIADQVGLDDGQLLAAVVDRPPSIRQDFQAAGGCGEARGHALGSEGAELTDVGADCAQLQGGAP